MAGVLQLLVLQQYSPPVWPSTVTCTTQTAHLSYSAPHIVSHYRLRHSSSYLQPHKQHTSVILHCKMGHTTCSDIQAVICNHRNSTPPLLCTVKCVTLEYSSSYLQPQKQHTSVILHCKMCHTQIFLQLPAALELCVYGVTDLYVDCKVMVISQIKM